MVAPLCPFLEERHASKLRTPNDQSILEKSSLLEVFDERGCRLVQNLSMDIVLLLECIVPIPIQPARARIGAIKELNETHSTFNQPPSQNAVASERRLVCVLGIVGSIHPEDMLRLSAQVAQFRHAQLHASRKLVTGDAGSKSCITTILLLMLGVHLLQQLLGCFIRFSQNPFGS